MDPQKNLAKNNWKIMALSLFLIILLSFFVFESRKADKITTNCADSSEKYNCWKTLLLETLDKKGLAASFVTLDNLYNTQPDFIPVCHTITHELGEQSYYIFSKNKKLDLSPNVSACGYGFYHGFMETLLHSGGNVEEAKEFCAYADEKLSAYGKKTVLSCYHGIGHGAVEEGATLKSYKTLKDFVQPGLDICSELAVSEIETHQCGTGVFNALAIALNSTPPYSSSKDNPYDVCSNQEEKFKKSCYEQMNTRALFVAGNDFDKAVKFVNGIPDRNYAMNAMIQLAADEVASKVGRNYSYSNEIKTCRSTPAYLQIPCIDGLVGGISEFGKPGAEYLEALNFCKSLEPVEDEMQNCYDSVVSGSRSLYTKDTTEKICSMIDPKYRNMCNQ